MRRTRILCLAALACAAVVAEPAAAQVQPAGTGEPAFTNSTQNTQWFEWPASPGADAYKIRFDYYANNALVSNPAYNVSQNGGSLWANWSGVATLQHGGQYGICAQGSYSFPNDSLFFPDSMNSCSMGTMIGRRTHTTIDRSKPTTALTLAGGAQYTKDPQVGLKIDFADDVAGPFPANFLCFQYGGGPTGVCDTGAGFIYGYNAACSVPATASKSTSFNCTADYASGGSPAPDGPVWACVIAADAAIPDNPNGSNQTQTADKANKSDPVCDGALLDRTAPQVSIGASATTVAVGELVSFSVQASDAVSGLGGSYEWAWGDNTAAGSGAAATHTFTQAGTYEVKVKTADAAGNAATATKVVTVAPAKPDGDGGGGQTGGGGGETGVGGGETGGGGSQTGGGGDDTGGDDAGDDVEPGFAISAPRRLKLPKAKSVRVSITADAPGRVSLALVRSGRVFAQGSRAVGEAGTYGYVLQLPKRAKAGAYSLKATYTPAGGRAATKTRKVTLAGKAKARGARASSGLGGKLAGAPRALPDGRFHGERPARTFAARALAG